MGSNSSRPKICQVAPSQSQPMEDKPSLLPTSPWMITVVKGTEMQEKGIVGQRKPNHLPPLTGAEEMEWRDGPVHCYSTPSLGGHCGTRKAPQEHVKGLQLVQTVLSRQATKKQQAQQRWFQERHRTPKKMCTTYVEKDEREGQKVKLVTRPRAQNIFWDEFEGQILDPRELMQPSPQLAGTNMGGTMHDKPLKEKLALPEAEDENVL
ncbi:uncharacterized protein LOC130244694 [Danio aesculapii]|uniref:uncharacterized protein LOC130244694 n=1 Tax=Danio aesculapii TaxID=1142201 RepID=UPI0024BFB7E3|nr:uncharacterized protein LOC130244694 [Danio aesculapii]